jgi:glucosyl-3-phosphoglycerate phosphatase
VQTAGVYVPFPMQQVLVMRHGESVWNVEGRWQGWSNPPLTARGESDAERRARHLAREGFRPRAVYSSDLLRASRTAEIVAGHLDVPMIIDAGFRERDVGEWAGHTNDEIDTGWPGMRERWRHGELEHPPGGETDASLLARFDIALVHALAHVGTGMLAIVCHHGNVRAVATRAGVPVNQRIPNLAGFWFDVDTDGTLCRPIAVDTLPDDDVHASVE